MSKFCGNCGTQLDDSAKVCGNCGTPLETNTATNATIPGISYVDPERKAKMKKKVKLFASLAVIVVVAVIAINIISGFVGYKGAVRKIMNAYEDYDLNTIVSMSSELYYFMDDESYADDYFGDIISNDLDSFENQVGHKYKLTYEITDSYKMSDHKYEDLLDTLSYYGDFDADIISKVMIVEVDVTAKEGRDSMTIELKLTLTKEDGSWKLLYLQ